MKGMSHKRTTVVAWLLAWISPSLYKSHTTILEGKISNCIIHLSLVPWMYLGFFGLLT